MLEAPYIARDCDIGTMLHTDMHCSVAGAREAHKTRIALDCGGKYGPQATCVRLCSGSTIWGDTHARDSGGRTTTHALDKLTRR